MKVYLIGVGMGNPATLTAQAREAIEESALLLGAPRLLEPYGHKPCEALLLAGDIAARIRREPAGPVGVLLSGDVGFYSGAAGLRKELTDCELVSIPGISSLTYFCALLNTTWQDVRVVSAHGRAHNAVGEIQSHSRTFLLTGGATKAADVCRALAERGLGQCRVRVGERLSYPDQRVVSGTAAELAELDFADLAVMLVENPSPIRRPWNSPGLPDEAFVRGKVPMTKAEVRTLALSWLRLEPHHVLWDVGAGTGSVSVEGALAVPAGRVYAVEKDPAALDLLRENRARFALPNLELVDGEAPAALAALPAPDRVFLGGTSGQLEQILDVIFEKNKTARIVLAAVTLETLAAAVEQFSRRGLAQVEMTQIAVTRTRTAGRYHLMDANNPVWLLSGEGQA